MLKVPGSVILISAPSGTGKTSLVTSLRQRLPNLRKSISHTTRAARQGEIDGVHYNFISREQFATMLQQDAFLENAEVFGNFYGTSEAWVRDTLKQGFDVVLEIDWQGAEQIRKTLDNVVSIFLLPPSQEMLLQRLNARNLDDAKVISARVEEAKNEVSHYNEYDYLIVNDDFAIALEQIIAIITAYKLRTSIQSKVHQDLLTEFLS